MSFYELLLSPTMCYERAEPFLIKSKYVAYWFFWTTNQTTQLYNNPKFANIVFPERDPNLAPLFAQTAARGVINGRPLGAQSSPKCS